MTESSLSLSDKDQAMVRGDLGSGTQWAIGLVIKVAMVLRAPRLVDADRAHLVGSYHSGPANIALLQRLVREGARIRIPTTLNASSADLSDEAPMCYRGDEQESARLVLSLLVKMGCKATLTCAPYFVDPPKFGERLAWAESNAVVYANSVLGARSLKTPQYLDLAAALCGRLPHAGPLVGSGRLATVEIRLMDFADQDFADPAVMELIGYITGERLGAKIPVITGAPSDLDPLALRAFCAALGVSGAMPMAHILGSTPEADYALRMLRENGNQHQTIAIGRSDLHDVARQLGRGRRSELAAVAIGAPHLSLLELKFLATEKDPFRVPVYLSVGRDVYQQADSLGLIARLQDRGGRIVKDTCTYYGSLMETHDGVVMTNSVKWTVYGRNSLRIEPIYATLAECSRSAVTGKSEYSSEFFDGL